MKIGLYLLLAIVWFGFLLPNLVSARDDVLSFGSIIVTFFILFFVGKNIYNKLKSKL